MSATLVATGLILYVPQAPQSEYRSCGHYFSDCPALKRIGAGRPAEELAPDTLRLLLRDLCKICERRARHSAPKVAA